MDKISVIIPTYNRFKYLLDTIKSIKTQTYKNIEIIVVNDGSTQQEYYEYDWGNNNIINIHLANNTKYILGIVVGYVINKGIEKMTGIYFATCDDDDIWFPNKIELQLINIKQYKCKMCCTDGLIGDGVYNHNVTYKKYNSEYYYKIINNIYNSNNSKLLSNGFPKIWTYDFLKVHNCIIACSVIIHINIIKQIGNMLEIKMGGTKINNKVIHIDYNYWLRH